MASRGFGFATLWPRYILVLHDQLYQEMWMYFFFPEVKMFFRVPGTSSRHCQSGGIRAHKWVLGKIGHFPRISRFFLHSSVYRYTWGTPSNFFHYISLWKFRNIVYNFLLCPVSISWVMNAQKNSKFERKDKRNGNPLLHHGFFSFFHENVHMNIKNSSLHFFLMPCARTYS